MFQHEEIRLNLVRNIYISKAAGRVWFMFRSVLKKHNFTLRRKRPVGLRGVVSSTPRPLYPREGTPGTHSIGGWVGPGTGLDEVA